jgi:hypothetical protein
MDAIARPVYELAHFGVPAPGLMTKMHPGLQQLIHGYFGHAFSFNELGLILRPLRPGTETLRSPLIRSSGVRVKLLKNEALQFFRHNTELWR